MNTFEFFPLIGEDLMIGVVASYFKEPAENNTTQSVLTKLRG